MVKAPPRRTKAGKLLWLGILGALLLTWGSWLERGAAQGVAPSTTISGFSPSLPPTPEKPPRPLKGPDAVDGFVDHLTQNDSAFEVVVGQGRILTTKADLAMRGKVPALVAVGDPTVIDFAVVSSKQIRIIGQRIGVTDLSITTPDNQVYSFEVRVVADLHVLRSQLQVLFPDASLRLAQIRDHIVVEGQARDSVQVNRIMETIRAYLDSVLAGQLRRISGTQRGRQPQGRPTGQAKQPTTPQPEEQPEQPTPAEPEGTGIRRVEGTVARPQIINLIRVPGSQQVLLKVCIAELNRTALRQIGSNFMVVDPANGSIIGSRMGGAVTPGASVGVAAPVGAGLIGSGLAGPLDSITPTAFGIFEGSDFNFFLNALRRNSMLRVLAEPNLVTLNGHAANFLAGGEFPVPVPQVGASGVAPTITVQFKEFGVRLSFLPIILDNNNIRLTVDPEVSNIDRALSTTLVAGGSPVPGLSTRRAHTVVELKEGNTLAIAGLLQLTLDGDTARIPLLGDLPVLGPFFSNTTGQRQERELIVLVTPFLVEGVPCDQIPPLPGDEVKTPTDLEFYLCNRIEGCHRDFRATTDYPCRCSLFRCLFRLDAKHVRGPHGYCD